MITYKKMKIDNVHVWFKFKSIDEGKSVEIRGLA